MTVKKGSGGTEPDFAAGRVLREVCRLVKRVARPRIEDGGQHHFILQRRSGRRRDGFKRLQRIRRDPGANDDLVCGAHECNSTDCDALRSAGFDATSLKSANVRLFPFNAVKAFHQRKENVRVVLGTNAKIPFLDWQAHVPLRETVQNLAKN